MIKPNIVSTRTQLASTQVDALHGVLDFLGPRFKGPVVIAESSAGFTSDKRLYHGGVRQTHVDVLLTAQQMRPFWGATVIDGFEGMEGNGPSGGTAVPSRIAIGSTDLVAADRVGVEAMGIDPSWVGYLQFCGQAGLGQYELSRIDIRGADLATVARKYQLHKDIERELKWMGPLREVPEKLG